MKRLIPFLLFPLLFAACEEDEMDFPESYWALSNSNEDAMFLSFFANGTMEVRNAADDMHPFDEADSWEYTLTRDSILHICYYETVYYTDDDYDGYYDDATTYDLHLSLTNNARTLTLSYVADHLFRPDDTLTYTFVRR